MGEKMKKAVVLILALLTTIAFSPFLFSAPGTQETTTPTDDRSQTSTTTTTTTSN